MRQAVSQVSITSRRLDFSEAPEVVFSVKPFILHLPLLARRTSTALYLYNTLPDQEAAQDGRKKVSGTAKEEREKAKEQKRLPCRFI
jgi:hypothetical protein